jgi:hypothetical protein
MTTTTEHHVPRSTCPTCGHSMDGAANFESDGEDPRPPDVGDFTICIQCTEILEFGPDLQLGLPSSGVPELARRAQARARRILWGRQ